MDIGKEVKRTIVTPEPREPERREHREPEKEPVRRREPEKEPA